MQIPFSVACDMRHAIGGQKVLNLKHLAHSLWPTLLSSSSLGTDDRGNQRPMHCMKPLLVALELPSFVHAGKINR